LGVGLTTLPCKKENCSEASKKFSHFYWKKIAEEAKVSAGLWSQGEREREREVAVL
jgi:hypothetical protein